MAKFYVSTPIFYVNDVPHIGHAYTTVIADALARWHRQLGDEVRFLTGTDEHGLKVQRAAEANGLTPIEHADITSRRYQDTWELLDISNDDFIRTTEPRHHAAVKNFMQQVYDNGWIYADTYDGLYSVSDEAYVTQADVDAGLVSGEVEQMSEQNYFFKLSAFEDRLLEWYEANPEALEPSGRRNEAIGIIKGGLQDISISRTSIDWGVPVPWDEEHVFYVWYDALINYATSIGYGVDDAQFAEWWPAMHHVMAKDILRFHAVYWPAMLMAAGIEPLPQLRVHGWLLTAGEKMSKSKANQIAPSELTDEFGVDGFRYLMLRDNPFGPDSDFSYEGLVIRYNTDLANNVGNLMSRVATVVAKKCDGIGSAPRADSPLAPLAATAVAAAIDAWDRFAPSVALDAAIGLVRETNVLLENAEPWKADPGPEVEAVMGDALEALRIVTILLAPAMPTICAELWSRLGLPGDPTDFVAPASLAWGQYPPGLAVRKAPPLFPRIKVAS